MTSEHLEREPSSSGGLGADAFDTGPPSESPTLLQSLKERAKSAVTACVLPLMQRTARAYIGGETVDDALVVVEHLAADAAPTTLGYWDSSRESAREVAAVYATAIERVAARGFDSYISIKPPALRFDEGLAVELAAAAQARGIGLHCDSHGPEVADPSRAYADAMLARLDAARVGVTLPGRWARSLADADWAIECGFRVRVVKGQWPDPDDAARDMRAGFLDVIDRLAGRARHVAVATHDAALAQEAVGRLRASGTSHEVETIYGMPIEPLKRWARASGVPFRIYVPLGPGYIPNALGILRRNPRLAWRMLGGLLPQSKLGRGPSS